MNRRIKVSVLVHELEISEGIVIHIIRKKLHVPKVSSWWVPKMLTPAQNRPDTCKENFQPLKQIGEHFASE